MEQQFKQYVKDLYLFDKLETLLDWDSKTSMPTGGAPFRAEMMEFVSRLKQQYESEHWITLERNFDDVEQFEQLTPNEKKMFRRLKAKMRSRVDDELRVAYTKALSVAQSAWKEARQAKDFERFKEPLHEVLVLKRQMFKNYDAVMQQFEKVTVAELDPLFEELKTVVLDIRANRAKRSTYSRHALRRYVPKAVQQRAYTELIESFGFQSEYGTVSETLHPVMLAIDRTDTRIAPRWNENDPIVAFFGMTHEAGHAIYEQSTHEVFDHTFLADGASAAMHEAQALFYSWIIGTSEAFWEGYYPKFQRQMNGAYDDLSMEEFYQHLTATKRTLNRFEADLLTYPLHIIIRYEIEKQLFEGTITVDEVRDVWNDMYEELLGIRPASDDEGILQDIHWANGEFGYFPTYTIGFIYALQLYDKMNEAFDVDAALRAHEFDQITAWLTEHIHRYGASKSTNILMKDATGESFTIEPAVKFLRKMYGTEEPLLDPIEVESS